MKAKSAVTFCKASRTSVRQELLGLHYRLIQVETLIRCLERYRRVKGEAPVERCKPARKRLAA